MSKATKATVKSFIRKNMPNMFINVKSSFDGMIDGCRSNNDGFVPVIQTESHMEHTMGIQGAWFVGSSRDYIRPYEDEGLKGFEISNACGSFIIAIKA